MDHVTVQQGLTVVTVTLLSVLSYFLKRFADAVFRVEDRLSDHDTRIAVVEDRLGLPRRRATDRHRNV